MVLMLKQLKQHEATGFNAESNKFKCTTDSKQKVSIAPNLLGHDFIATIPNQKWAVGNVYLATSARSQYLAEIIDFYY